MNQLELHQRKVARNYMRELARLLDQGRFTEAKHMNLRFTGIMALWEIQAERIKVAATKGLERTK